MEGQMEQHSWLAVDGQEEESGSQESSEQDRQCLINTYVTMMLQLLQLNPWVAIPQVLEELVEVGPLWSANQILEVFGGWETFRRTLQRMEVIRGNTVRGDLRGLPITTRPPADEPFGTTIPSHDGFIAWWAPQIAGTGPPFMFTITRAGGEPLSRYPHTGSYTVDYVESVDSDSSEASEHDH